MKRTSFCTLIFSLLSIFALVAQELPAHHAPYTPENTILVFDVDDTLVIRPVSIKKLLWKNAGLFICNAAMGPKMLQLLYKDASVGEYIETCEQAGYTDLANAIREIAETKVVIPGMKEFIEQRKKEGFTLHIATNQAAAGFEACKKNNADFFKLFDYAYVSTMPEGSTKHLKKPHVDYFKDYLAKTPSNKPYRFFWDDKKVNVDAAKTVGIDGAVFTSAKQAEKDFKKYFAPTVFHHQTSALTNIQPTTP